MTLSIFSQNFMSFPEIPENFKIPENPRLFHDRGNPVSVLSTTLKSKLYLPSYHKLHILPELFSSKWVFIELYFNLFTWNYKMVKNVMTQ